MCTGNLLSNRFKDWTHQPTLLLSNDIMQSYALAGSLIQPVVAEFHTQNLLLFSSLHSLCSSSSYRWWPKKGKRHSYLDQESKMYHTHVAAERKKCRKQHRFNGCEQTINDDSDLHPFIPYHTIPLAGWLPCTSSMRRRRRRRHRCALLQELESCFYFTLVVASVILFFRFFSFIRSFVHSCVCLGQFR